jgi:two-component system cell cycle response regulator
MSGHILIVDDLSINRTILRARLSAACYTCIMAATGQDAIEMARAHRPDLVLLDFRLPDLNGQEVCRALRADPVTRDIPVILFSASTDRDLRLQALQAGADDFLAKPLDDSYLLGRIRSLLRARDVRADCDVPTACGMAEAPANFALPNQLAVLTEQHGVLDPALVLATQGAVIGRLSVQQALRMDPNLPGPDVILLAPDVIQAQGLQIISDLRSRAGTRDAELCILLPAGQDLMAAMALDLGATEILRLPLDPDEAALRLRAVLRHKSCAKARARAVAVQMDQALRDPLTGLFNRRYLVAELWRMGQAQDGSIGAVLVLDLDHFKSVNDRFGHVAGDDVLVDVATRIRQSLRKSDILARYGGEEFVVLLPRADLNTAQQIAVRIGGAVQTTTFLADSSDGGVRVTASIGVAVIDVPKLGQGPEEFARTTIDAADIALRAAKDGGRNRIVTGMRALA